MEPSLEVPAATVRVWTDAREARDVALAAGAAWCATTGGVLRLSPGPPRLYTLADGLPDNRALSLLGLPDGTLWVGTVRGAARFDGSRFVPVTTGLPGPTVSALGAGADSRIWAGTDKGIALLRGDAWEVVTDTHEFARRSVRDIARGPDGTLWFAKENALTWLPPSGGWRTLQRDTLRLDPAVGLPSNTLLSVAAAPDGTLWIGTGMGLAAWDRRSWRVFTFPGRLGAGAGLDDNRVASVAVNADGSVWIGHGRSRDFVGGAGVARGSGDGRWSYLGVADGLPSGEVLRVRTPGDGSVWLATAAGPARVAAGSVEAFRPPAGLPDNVIVDLIGVPPGVVAVTSAGPALLGDGAPRPLEAPGSGHPLVAAEVSGRSWWGDAAGGMWSSADWETWEEEVSFRGMTVTSVSGDARGDTVVAAAGRVFRGRPGSWAEEPLGIPGVGAVRAAAAGDGTLLVAGERPLYGSAGESVVLRESGGGFRLLEVPAAARRYAARNRLSVAPSGETTLVSPAGVWRERKGWEHVPTPLPRGSLWAAAWDRDGRLWAAGRDGGLFVREKGGWREVRVAGGPGPAGVTTILPDAGRIWLGTGHQGVVRLDLP